jgi:hypothetical protein
MVATPSFLSRPTTVRKQRVLSNNKMAFIIWQDETIMHSRERIMGNNILIFAVFEL